MIKLMSESTFKVKFGKGVVKQNKVHEIVSETVERIRRMYEISK